MRMNMNDYLKVRVRFLAIYIQGLHNSKKFHPENWDAKDELELNNLKIRKAEMEKLIQYAKENNWNRVCTRYNLKIKGMKEHSRAQQIDEKKTKEEN